MKKILAILLCSTAARADVRVAWGNDAFAPTRYPVDDSGFTNDLALAAAFPVRQYEVGVSIFDRWLTEVDGPRRCDQLDALATISRGPFSARIGPTFSGDLGGRWGQDAWHSLTHTGPTLAQGLQDQYPGERHAGVLVGFHARVEQGPLYATLDPQLALGGAGVSWLELFGGVQGTVGHAGAARFDLHAELGAAIYDVNDPYLALPGGYREDLEAQLRAGVRVAWSRYAIEYELRVNEGNSGEPIGVLSFTVADRR